MANMSKLLLVAFAIHFVLILTGIADIPGSSMYNFLTDPTGWDSSEFLNTFVDLIGLVGVGLIIAGTLFARGDLLVFAGISGVFLTFGLALAELFSIVSAQSSEVIAILFVSPIMLIYIVAVLSFWRGRAD